MLHRPYFLPLAMLKLVIRGLDDNPPIPIHIVPRWQWDKYVNCNHRYSILIVNKLIELSFFPSHTSFEEVDKETSETWQNSSQLKATQRQHARHMQYTITTNSNTRKGNPVDYYSFMTKTLVTANHNDFTVIKSGGIFVLHLGWCPVTEY